MANADDIREGMQVIGSDGGMVGRAIGLRGDHLHVEPTAPVRAGDHTIPRSWIARVDDHVHLDRNAALVRDTWGASDGDLGATSGNGARVGPAAGTVAAGAHNASHRGMGKSWIVWLIGAILLLLVIVLGIRGCGYAARDANYEDDAKGEISEADRAASGVAAAGTGAAAGNLNADVQAYLASSGAAPRTFTLQNLTFDTSSAEIRSEYREELTQLGRTLAGRLSSRVRIVGYADPRGGAGANADLGKRRAEAVAAALTANGVAAANIEAASGGETADAQNLTKDRRTELVILSR